MSAHAGTRSIEEIAAGLWWIACLILRNADPINVRPLSPTLAAEAMRLALAAAVEVKASEETGKIVDIAGRFGMGA